jgi:hypothetical protein
MLQGTQSRVASDLNHLPSNATGGCSVNPALLIEFRARSFLMEALWLPFKNVNLALGIMWIDREP